MDRLNDSQVRLSIGSFGVSLENYVNGTTVIPPDNGLYCVPTMVADPRNLQLVRIVSSQQELVVDTVTGDITEAESPLYAQLLDEFCDTLPRSAMWLFTAGLDAP